METEERLRAYFNIEELVSQNVYRKLGDEAWRLFDPRLLATLLALRTEILQVPLVCNNWRKGGSLQQRGYRENTSPIVKAKTNKNELYLSTHCLGQGIDLSSGMMTADKMRMLILQKRDLLPYPVRIEDGASAPTWLHIDVSCPPGQREQVYIFK